ncbi:MAG: leucyl/phenylalanyl-tRNA--protein transferase [Bacteroidetes bacterium]|nr:leucyl/phenylalanyl-tRNA--protein transferase [Bacteroidota bacterium]
MKTLSVNLLLNAYKQGVFPMSDAQGEINWYFPNPRAIIPIETYKPSKSLRNILNRKIFEVKINTSFVEVMRACSVPRYTGDGCWISEEMIAAYSELNKLGFAHSVEAFQNGILVGGLYGVQIGGVFFGESMFTNVSNASKVAFHELLEILKKQRFLLLDTQFINENVERYGAIEIPRKLFLEKLEVAISTPCEFKMIK